MNDVWKTMIVLTRQVVVVFLQFQPPRFRARTHTFSTHLDVAATEGRFGGV